MSIGGQNKTKDAATVLTAQRTGKTVKINVGNNKKTYTITMSGVTPGSDSLLCKKSRNRSFMVDPKRVTASSKVSQVDIGGVRFIADKGSMKPKDKDQLPFKVTSDTPILVKGIMTINGTPKSLNANVPINFNNEK